MVCLPMRVVVFAKKPLLAGNGTGKEIQQEPHNNHTLQQSASDIDDKTDPTTCSHLQYGFFIHDLGGNTKRNDHSQKKKGCRFNNTRRIHLSSHSKAAKGELAIQYMMDDGVVVVV